MSDKIKSVTSINQLGSRRFELGIDEVEQITNNSLEYEDHIHIQYDAYDKDGKIIGTFINGALAIEYER